MMEHSVYRVGVFGEFEVFIPAKEETTEDGNPIYFILSHGSTLMLICASASGKFAIRSDDNIPEAILSKVPEVLKQVIQFLEGQNGD